MSRPVPWIRQIALFPVAAVVGCIVHSAPLAAMTVRPARPDPWFTVSLDFKKSYLPKAIRIEQEPNYGGFDVSFVNPTHTPFYLVTKPDVPPAWVRDLPPNVVPISMAARHAAFYMKKAAVWSDPYPGGIAVRSLLERPGGVSRAVDFKTDVYLGKRKFAIAGRYYRRHLRLYSNSWQPDVVTLHTPLPAPLVLVQGRQDPEIVNDGSVPFYTVVVLGKPLGWVAEVPYGYLGALKLVDGKAYRRDWPPPSARRHPQKFAAFDGWREIPANWTQLSQYNFAKYFPRFRFRQVFYDGRPRHVKVPESQTLQAPAFYGSRKFLVTVRVRYRLNRKYDPHAESRGPTCTSCTGPMCDQCYRINRHRREAPRYAPAR